MILKKNYCAVAVLTAFALTATVAEATITVESGLPAGAFISVDNDGVSNGATRVTPAGGAAYHIKGNSFTLDSTYDIMSVTVRVDDESDIVDGDGSFTLDLYNITTGIPDDIQNTGQVPDSQAIFSQTDVLPAIAMGDYLTIALDTPATLGPGIYGWTVATTDAEMFLDIRNDPDNGAYTAGELIRTRTDTGVWQDRNFDMVFAIDGRLVPEPCSAWLVMLAGVAMISLRRRR